MTDGAAQPIYCFPCKARKGVKTLATHMELPSKEDQEYKPMPGEWITGGVPPMPLCDEHAAEFQDPETIAQREYVGSGVEPIAQATEKQVADMLMVMNNRSWDEGYVQEVSIDEVPAEVLEQLAHMLNEKLREIQRTQREQEHEDPQYDAQRDDLRDDRPHWDG